MNPEIEVGTQKYVLFVHETNINDPKSSVYYYVPESLKQNFIDLVINYKGVSMSAANYAALIVMGDRILKSRYPINDILCKKINFDVVETIVLMRKPASSIIYY